MATMTTRLADTVATRHGIVARDELIADGHTTNSIRDLVSGGLLVSVHQGVFRLATSPDTFESRCAAACLADPEAVISGPAAARLWGFRHVFRVDRPIVLVAHDRTPMTTGVLLRRTNRLDRSDSMPRHDGIRVARPERAWFDCARDLTDEKFENLTEWVLDQHTTMPALWALTRRLEARGRPGLARVHRVMARRSDWQRPAGSGIELRVLNALERHGVGPLVRQHPLLLPNGVTIHLDGADVAHKWGVEVDHVTWHGGRFDAQRDKARDRNARRIGWQIDRITDQEVSSGFALAIAELVDLHRRRCLEVGRAA